MKTNNNIEFNNGTIKVTTVKEHTFSELEMNILKKLVLHGYYETQYVDCCSKEGAEEHGAMFMLCHLDIAEYMEDAWKETIKLTNDCEKRVCELIDPILEQEALKELNNA